MPGNCRTTRIRLLGALCTPSAEWSWRVSAAVVVFAVQLVFAARAFWGTVLIGDGADWAALTEGGRRVAAGINPYETDLFGVGFRWHPLTAWFFYLITPLGVWSWRLVNLASLALLRDWRPIALALLSWPLWDAMYSGNATIIVVAAGFAALAGSRAASVGYLALCALIPRPWMAPLALWLVWKRPDLRPWAGGLAVASVATAFALGWGVEWAGKLVESTNEMGNAANWSPTRWLGPAWLIVGVPLGAWLTWKGRLGVAALAVTPYAFIHYYLALLWDTSPFTASPDTHSSSR